MFTASHCEATIGYLSFLFLLGKSLFLLRLSIMLTQIHCWCVEPLFLPLWSKSITDTLHGHAGDDYSQCLCAYRYRCDEVLHAERHSKGGLWVIDCDSLKRKWRVRTSRASAQLWLRGPSLVDMHSFL